MRTPSRLAAVLATAAALVAVPSAASAVPADPAAAVEPTSRGEAVVGFVALPLGLSAGSTLRGYPVVRTDAGGAFAVVAATDAAALRRDLAGLPGLRYVEDNVTKVSLATPNDPSYTSTQYGPQMMGAPAAWDRGYGSASVVVSVIDTGIRRTHQDITASRVLGGYDYVNNDSDPADDCDHGTHVSGTVAATTNNGIGVAGMSQATILPYKVLDRPDLLGRCSGSAANIASAIRAAADNGAKIISMSIGGPGSTVERDAVQYAYAKGAILVAASGNGGSNNGVDFPAAYPEVVAVAALDRNKVRASYSDGGPAVDIAAPGSDVISTIDNSDSAYGTMSGTSMATPHVSGALALALSCAPGVSRTTLINALYSTAEDLGTAGRDDIYGNGLARVDRLVSNVCGTGGTTNNPPTASFTHTASGLTVSVDAAGSSDPDGDALTYSWTFGDGATATGRTASRTYAAAGTYTIGLTVSDGRGGSASTSKTVTVSTTSDPDPSTPNLTSGQAVSVTLSGAGDEKFFKIAVPAGKSQLRVAMTGPACGLLGCTFDADLYTRLAARPTDTVYTCRPFQSGSNETCTHTAPASGYWYVRVDAYTGSGTVNLTATVS
ncbi:MAG TPA: S8 family serine peptidase [Frankiaceae bacterium]|nr:S8 family serine peptidase [Frankiaceae bacterium]